mmetsp:Transcript_8453/g.22120  ORF Transcript_8453/g.22120 Transcript_8453/m.22120 type:complete len:89 (-) Transcript_8453:123-389(-)
MPLSSCAAPVHTHADCTNVTSAIQRDWIWGTRPTNTCSHSSKSTADSARHAHTIRAERAQMADFFNFLGHAAAELGIKEGVKMTKHPE